MARSTEVGGRARRLVSRAITEDDTNTTVHAITVPAGSFVPPYGVTLYVAEVFAGGTPSLDVGDGSDTDGWVDTTDVTETTAGCYSGTEANTGAYAATGKVYTAEDTIDVVVSASLTGGTAYVIADVQDIGGIDLTAN
ncbi:MAG: hypothetical protein ACE5HE_14330 [Phycisphaerae bacterium]